MSLKVPRENKDEPLSSDLDSAREDTKDASKIAKPATTQSRKMDLESSALAAFRKTRGIRNNTVVTSKYTWWTFLPVNLFLQFTTKVANLYFLVIMFMQMIKVISISNG